MPSKSIFRQPGAKNFQLVHRSQRDPLINDPEASERVLKEFERKNAKVGCVFSYPLEGVTDYY
jgi:protein LTV1